MSAGSILTTLGKKIIINRSYSSSPSYSIPTKFGVGVDGNTPNLTDIDLDSRIPISNGDIISDGTINFTGENSGSASSSETTTYKEGAGTTDNTSQNLISDGTGTAKTWVLETLNQNASGTANSTGFFLYIKDSTAYNKLVTSGTAIEARFGSGTGDYYTKSWTASESGTGWNWFTTGTALNNLDMSGSVDGVIDVFGLEIITSGTSDSFSSGDIIFDLLRQWDEETDGLKSWLSGSYPSLNESTFTVEMRGELSTTEANGFDIDSFGNFNTDTPKKLSGEDVFTAESKSSTDKFTFIIQDRLE